MDPTEYPGPHSGVATIRAEQAGVISGNTVARTPQVGEQVGQLEPEVNRLHGLIDDLEVRLAAGGVLQSEPEAGKLDTGMDTLVPLADRLRHERHRLQAAGDRLSSLISRLEV